MTEGEFERLSALCSRVSLQFSVFGRMKIEWDRERGPSPELGYRITLRVVCKVPDRRTPPGEPPSDTITVLTRELDAPLLMHLSGGDEAALRYLRAMVRGMLVFAASHEIDEMLLVDGERNDPHLSDVIRRELQIGA